ncbi:hypothetical protein ABPG72_008367 [Tetrahymena utriculariae]
MPFFKKKEPKKTKEQLEKEEEDKKAEEEKKILENEKQIEVAYRFLMQPEVQKFSDINKRVFLRKRGLTTDQIDQAFKRRDEKKDSPQTSTEQQQVIQQEQKASEENKSVLVYSETLEQKLATALKNGFLSIQKSNSTELSPKIFEVANLKTLVASQNMLKEIPDSIGKLVNLRVVQFSECGLTNDVISDKLFSLPNLVELNLSKNKLTSIHLIVNLPELQRLDISYNNIVELPEDIEKCQKLQLMNVQNNYINFFPHNFTKLVNLKRILISGNQFEKDAEDALKSNGVEGLFKFLSQ